MTLYFGSLFIPCYFQNFLKRATNSKQARLDRAERGQPLYLRSKLGSSPPGSSPAKLSHLQTVSRYFGSNEIAGQVTSKPRTSGLLVSIQPVPHQTAPADTDTIGKMLQPSWVNNPCNQNMNVRTQAVWTHTCFDNVHKHLICHLYSDRHAIHSQTCSQNSETLTCTFNIWVHLKKRRKREKSYCKSTQSENRFSVVLFCCCCCCSRLWVNTGTIDAFSLSLLLNPPPQICPLLFLFFSITF